MTWIKFWTERFLLNCEKWLLWFKISAWPLFIRPVVSLLLQLKKAKNNSATLNISKWKLVYVFNKIRRKGRNLDFLWHIQSQTQTNQKRKNVTCRLFTQGMKEMRVSTGRRRKLHFIIREKGKWSISVWNLWYVWWNGRSFRLTRWFLSFIFTERSFMDISKYYEFFLNNHFALFYCPQNNNKTTTTTKTTVQLQL